MKNRPIKYWIIVASRDHVQMGVAGGFAQACHGKAQPLKRMQEGDGILYYSSKRYFGKEDKCQAFTAIGRVKDEEVYAFQMSENFCPFRRNIIFVDCEETPIADLIELLEFIPNKKAWGYPFRFGILEISENDFKLIASKMLHNDLSALNF